MLNIIMSSESDDSLDNSHANNDLIASHAGGLRQHKPNHPSS